MFGFEFQTNANLFQSGVRERETAFEHKSKLLTLEGDETHDYPDLSELEFVTAPCDSLSKAREATGYATALAEALREKWESPGRSGFLKFEKGEEYAGGTWMRDCTISIENRPFEAQPQATIGVPLAGLPEFLCTALRGVGDEQFANDMENEMLPRAGAALAERGVERPSPELMGFLSACHYFIWRATNDNTNGVAVKVIPGEDPVPVAERAHGSWKIFSFPSAYLAQWNALRTSGDECRVLANRDSPKSSFEILHRTDFYAMFHMVPTEERISLPEQVWPEVIWPYSKRDFLLFPFPYRAEPVSNLDQPQPVKYRGAGWCDRDGDSRAEAVEWYLMEHGPSLLEWCDSVLNGRPVPGGLPGARLEKDLASPPPGLQGRRPELLASFPPKDEDKTTFYSMGAFPRDNRGQQPLAVFEYRALARDRILADLLSTNRLVRAKDWTLLVQRFCETYVKS